MSSRLDKIRERALQQTPEDILEEFEKEKRSSYSNDDDIWKLTLDANKEGDAIVRLIPSYFVNEEGEEDEINFVRRFDHFFKGPTGKNYVENCLSTFPNTEDPVLEMNSRLYNTGIESDKKIVKDQTRRRKYYYSYIYIIDDKAKPENNGTVQLFRYGPQIKDLIEDAVKDDKILPFNLFSKNGANFHIRARRKSDSAEHASYEKSRFIDKGPLDVSDEELEKIVTHGGNLNDLIAPENFKTYDELCARLLEVMGPEVGSGVATLTRDVGNASDSTPSRSSSKKKDSYEGEEDDEGIDFDTLMSGDEVPETKPKKKSAAKKAEVEEDDDTSDDLDDELQEMFG